MGEGAWMFKMLRDLITRYISFAWHYFYEWWLFVGKVLPTYKISGESWCATQLIPLQSPILGYLWGIWILWFKGTSRVPIHVFPEILSYKWRLYSQIHPLKISSNELYPSFFHASKPFNDTYLSQSFPLEQYSGQIKQYCIHCDDVVFEKQRKEDTLCTISPEQCMIPPIAKAWSLDLS